MEDYTPVVRTCLHAWFTIKFIHAVQSKLLSLQPTKQKEFFFNSDALQAAAREKAWPNHELVGMLTYGGHDYSSETPPVPWSPRICPLFLINGSTSPNM